MMTAVKEAFSGGTRVAAQGTALAWPKISIVTPTFRGGQYLEACIESVLSQNYPNLEFIVVDGGSTDETVEILRRYDDQLTYWVSEKDRGQSDAINKGFSRCTGEILNWLCSDDKLMPGALETVAKRFMQEPGLDVLAGGCRMVYAEGGEMVREEVLQVKLEAVRLIPYTNPIRQPSCFWRKRLRRPAYVVDVSFHYAMDTELWSHFVKSDAVWGTTDAVLSEYLMSGENKTSTGGKKILREIERLCRMYCPAVLPVYVISRGVFHPLRKYASAKPGTFLGRSAKGVYGVCMKIGGRVFGFDRLSVMNLTYECFDPPVGGAGGEWWESSPKRSGG